MQFNLIILALTLMFTPFAMSAPSAKALLNANHNASFLRCGTEHPSAAEAKSLQAIFMQRKALLNGKKPDNPGGGNGNGNGNGGGGEPPPPTYPGPGTIPVAVYFHVITDSRGAGNVSDAIIADQLFVINEAYGSNGSYTTPYTFNLASTDRTGDNSWYTAGHGSTAQT